MAFAGSTTGKVSGSPIAPGDGLAEMVKKSKAPEQEAWAAKPVTERILGDLAPGLRGREITKSSQEYFRGLSDDDIKALYAAINSGSDEGRQIADLIDRGGYEDGFTARLGETLTNEEKAALIQDMQQGRNYGAKSKGDFLDDGMLAKSLDQTFGDRLASGQLVASDFDAEGRVRKGTGRQAITANAFNTFANLPPEELYKLDMSLNAMSPEQRAQMQQAAQNESAYFADAARKTARDQLQQSSARLKTLDEFSRGKGDSIAQQRYLQDATAMRRDVLNQLASSRGGFNPAAQRAAFQAAAEGRQKLAAQASINETAERRQALLDYLTGSAQTQEMGYRMATSDAEIRGNALQQRNQLYNQGLQWQAANKQAQLGRYIQQRQDAAQMLGIMRGQKADTDVGWRIYDAVTGGVTGLAGLVSSFYGGGGGGGGQKSMAAQAESNGKAQG